MLPRFHIPLDPRLNEMLSLPAAAARHVQVLRLQPGNMLRLFDGAGGEWSARIDRMGRNEVDVSIVESVPALPELVCRVTLAIGMPANERMDSLVEKATELGVALLQPLICERSVMRVDGDRALKKVAHWQAIAVAACEQSGRATVPVIAPISRMQTWLDATQLGRTEDHASASDFCGLLSLGADARPIASLLPMGSLPRKVTFLSGPEGGLSAAEEVVARAAGYTAMSLGRRTLRADTAPLAALAWVSMADVAAH